MSRFMNMSRVADVGLSSITNAPIRFAANAQRFDAMGQSYPQDTIGWINPNIIYSKMAQIQASAEALNLDIQRYVADPRLNNAWDAWYTQWKALYEKYAGPNYRVWPRLMAPFETEDLNKLVEENRQQLLWFRNDYARHTQPNGQPVPPPSGAPPERFTPAQETGRGWEIPWYIYFLAGVAVVGIGYLGYRKAQELTAKRKAIETKVLPKIIGPEWAEAAAARDYGAPFTLEDSDRQSDR